MLTEKEGISSYLIYNIVNLRKMPGKKRTYFNINKIRKSCTFKMLYFISTILFSLSKQHLQVKKQEIENVEK